MKLLKILLLFLISMSLYAQQEYFITPKAIIGGQYTPTEIDSGISTILGDNYFRKVGGGEGNYPLTAQGLKDAIASLDSGTVQISYPGLWDTSGLGAIKNKVVLTGYLFGNLVYVFNQSDSYAYADIIGDVGSDKLYYSIESVNNKARNRRFDNRLSWWASNDYVTFQNENKRIIDANSRTLNTNISTYISNNSGTNYSAQALENKLIFSNASSSGYASSQTYHTISSAVIFKNVRAGTFWTLRVHDAFIDFGSGGAVTTTNGAYGYSFRIGSIGSGASLGGNFYAFHSDLSTNVSKITGTKYHFYGLGNQPSFFGGRVEALNFKLSALNTAPATSTSTGTVGEIRIDANYIYICVATNTWKRVALNETTW